MTAASSVGEPGPSLADMLERAQAGVLSVPESWHQGRTVYGGLTAALALTAARGQLDEQLPLRAAQFVYTAAVDGPVSTTARLLHGGKSSANVEARCHSSDSVCLNASILFARSRSSKVVHSFLPAPLAPAPEDCPDALRPSDPRPNCAVNFDMRLAGGHRVLSGADDPELVAWVRHKDAASVDPEAALIAIADSLPPAALVSVDSIAPISTVNWSIHVCAAEPVDPSGWFLLRVRSLFADKGFSYQEQHIWGSDGSLVATASQSVAVYV